MPTKHYVYTLQSISHPDQFYTGLCSDVAARLIAHNGGQSPHTSKYKPWTLRSYHWFSDEPAAIDSSVTSRAVRVVRSPQSDCAD